MSDMYSYFGDAGKKPKMMFPYSEVLAYLKELSWWRTKDSAGATNALEIAQAEGGALGGQTRIGEFQSAGSPPLAEGTISSSGGDACSTGGRTRGAKRSKEDTSQAKALERSARGIKVLAAAAQKRIKLAEVAMRLESVKAAVNAAVEALKLPSSMPVSYRKLLQQQALRVLAGFGSADISPAAATTPSVSDNRLDMDDADDADDALDLSKGEGEQEKEE
jgi:hypothetical protein